MSWSRMTGVLQRKCACGRQAEGECGVCRRAIRPLDRHNGKEAGPPALPQIVHSVLGRPGRPLDANPRSFMESRFGRDFSGVRIHTDDLAARSAKSVNALAYTVGRDIAFGQSQYAPDTRAGRSLLAHELTHTLQQNSGMARAGIAIGAAASPQEREADRVSDAVMSGARPERTVSRVMELLQREPAPGAAEDEEKVEQTDDGEAHDGDSPVRGGSDASEEANPERGLPAVAMPDTGSAVELQEGGGKKPAHDKPSADKPAQKKPDPPPTITRIDVDLGGSQKMTVTFSDGTTEEHVISSGRGMEGTTDDPCTTQEETNCTPTGDFKPGIKKNGSFKNEHNDAMAWYVELTGGEVVKDRGIGIHDSQKADGTPKSHGCIRVGDTPADKKFAEKINKGVTKDTVVHVAGKADTKPHGTPKKKAGASKAAGKKK